MAEWSEGWTGNLEAPGLSPLSDGWICFRVVPCSNHLPHFVSSQLVSPPTSWDF